MPRPYKINTSGVFSEQSDKRGMGYAHPQPPLPLRRGESKSFFPLPLKQELVREYSDEDIRGSASTTRLPDADIQPLLLHPLD